ncbi:conserved exported protein of unknown function [Rhodovastum atsumiense]|uniref:Uncharacterized protein n=1 Tax=Rhodovastum atsumiense TaxID=504468 RepID=A0A5M6ITW0_9PROT|nr:hypothetical protein [Rhodovastum atsumiense]KAA5611763.1 hypothetical protein F1189_13295 [Rhodovastum atsumiense]CAH2604347.1 conserved exported protein of unknown function [Rhodovastum atsumiense]
MKFFVAALGALIAFGMAGQACAATIKPGQGVETQIGSYSLVSYFTRAGSDLRVVTTAQRIDDERGEPIRMVATLAPGQEAILSVPQKLGEPALSVTIIRVGDSIELHCGNAGQ